MSTKSSNVRWEEGCINRELFEKRNGHKPAVLWFTGFSGSGKSTVAKAVLHKLFDAQMQVTLLDGENVRHGLCGDLGFSSDDRTENIRRVGEVAHLFYETGMIVLCTFISPFLKDRQQARPRSEICRSSMVTSSVMEKQSCTSIMLISSFGFVIPASWYAFVLHLLVVTKWSPSQSL